MIKKTIALITSVFLFSVLSVQTVLPSSTPGTDIKYFFTRANNNPQKELVSLISSSKSTLDIAIYSLTSKDIVNAIISSKKRGVTVNIITDKQEARGKTQKQQLKLIKKAGIPVKINSHKGLMHLKITIIDNKIATTGSYNYTKAASTYNDEVLFVINNPKTAQDFDKEFKAMWNNSSDYCNY